MSLSKRSLRIIGIVGGVVLIVAVALLVGGGDGVRTITLDDGASISIPRGAVSSDASVNATILAPENGPEVPDGFTIETLYEFNTDEPLSETVTLRLPLTSITDDSVLWVAKYDDASETWHGVEFTVEDGYAVIQTETLSIFGTIRGTWDDFVDWATETAGSVYQWATNEVIPRLTVDHWISQFEEITGLDKVINEPLFTNDSLMEYDDDSSYDLVSASARVTDDGAIEIRIQNKTKMYLQLYFEGPSVEPVRGGYLTLADVLEQFNPGPGMRTLIENSFLAKSVILLPESTADFHAAMESGDALQIRAELSDTAALFNGLDPFFALVPIVDLEVVTAIRDVKGSQSEFYQELLNFESEWFEKVDAGLSLSKEIGRAGWQLGTKGLETIANLALWGAPAVTELADRSLGRIEDIMDKGADAISGGVLIFTFGEAGAGESQYILTVSSTAGGSVTTPGEGTYPYNAGTIVSLTATPTSGYLFVKWTGSVDTIADVNAATTTITMNGSYLITASFEQEGSIEPRQITHISGKLSPDWAKIAYWQKIADGQFGFYIANRDGSNARKIEVSRSTGDYSWSPTGMKIVFHVVEDGLKVVNIDGTGMIKLGEGGREMRWSPDERMISFIKSALFVGEDYYIVPADGSEPPKEIMHASYFSENILSWTSMSDGLIVIKTDIGHPPAVLEIDLNGEIRERLFAVDLKGIKESVICPNLERLLVLQQWESMAGTKEAGVFVMDMDGNNWLDTGIPPWETKIMCWSPDGQTIAYLTEIEEQTWVAGQGEYVTTIERDIWIVDRQGQGHQHVVGNVASLYGWNLNGNEIAYTIEGDEGISAIRAVHTP